MKIATWNVNSVRKRAANLTAFLKRVKPDILVLQELKAQDDQFPHKEVEDAGYKCEVFGQKAYNGVAMISTRACKDVMRGLPGDDNDTQSRYIEAHVDTRMGPLTVGGLYLPNGNPIGSDKFDYKLAWMKRLETRAKELLAKEEMFVLAGDFNVCPTDMDVYDPKGFAKDALCQPEARAAYRRLLNLGLTDAVRALHPDDTRYTYWDYMAGAWQKDNGLRIDHLLLSPQAADRLRGAEIEKSERGKPEPSDHVPVWVELDVGD